MKVSLISKPDPWVCAKAAGLCYNASDPWRAVKAAMKCGHESVIEHCVFSFLVEDVSRVLLAQLTRHRLASYSVESQRYCGANMECVIPATITADPELIRDALDIQHRVESFYNKALEKGVPAEDARYFTLQGGMTRLMVTMNARELRHFFSLRCCNRAQWEIREMADEMLSQARQAAPELFADAGPGCIRGACPEGRKSCGRPRDELKTIKELEETNHDQDAN